VRAASGLALLALAGCSFDPAALAGLGGGPGGGGGAAVDGGADAAGQADAGPADAAEAAAGTVQCARTAQAPELDGTADGPWIGATWYHFVAADADLIADKHPSYQFDAELRFACLHDEAKVYFFLEVEDDLIVTNSLSLRQDDGVVLFINGDGERRGPYSPSDHALMITAEPKAHDYGPGSLDPEGTRLLTSDGYNLEIALDKLEIASPLPAALGFNVALIDDDGHGNNNRDLFALRHVPHPPACASCCEGEAAPWCDTRVTGLLILED
jgi:hypothetical protein